MIDSLLFLDKKVYPRINHIPITLTIEREDDFPLANAGKIGRINTGFLSPRAEGSLFIHSAICLHFLHKSGSDVQNLYKKFIDKGVLSKL